MDSLADKIIKTKCFPVFA